MRPLRRSSTALAIAALGAVMVSGCATVAGSGPVTPGGPLLGEVQPPPPDGEVIGEGTVLDVAGDVHLCLGAVAESYPPQCSGIPITNWTWDGVDGFETSDETSWGTYAVQGTYDGETFTLTQDPIMLALFDPPAQVIPEPTAPAEPLDEETLLGIQDELNERLGTGILSSSVSEGQVQIQVVWDDGTLQQAADDEFGTAVLMIRSALRPVG